MNKDFTKELIQANEHVKKYKTWYVNLKQDALDLYILPNVK